MNKHDLILLIESELNSLTSDDIVTDKYLKDNLLNSDDADSLFYQYKSENNVDSDIDFDEFEKDKRNLDDFYNWLKYEFENRFENQQDLYNSLFSGGRLTLFRAMNVSKEWIKSLMQPNVKLGIYWAYEEDAAEAHWGSRDTEEAVLQTSVTENEVDWENTFLANLHPSLGEDEKETRLKENAKIHLEALWINKKEIKLNNKIKSNIYLA